MCSCAIGASSLPVPSTQRPRCVSRFLWHPVGRQQRSVRLLRRSGFKCGPAAAHCTVPAARAPAPIAVAKNDAVREHNRGAESRCCGDSELQRSQSSGGKPRSAASGSSRKALQWHATCEHVCESSLPTWETTGDWGAAAAAATATAVSVVRLRRRLAGRREQVALRQRKWRGSSSCEWRATPREAWRLALGTAEGGRWVTSPRPARDACPYEAATAGVCDSSDNRTVDALLWQKKQARAHRRRTAPCSQPRERQLPSRLLPDCAAC